MFNLKIIFFFTIFSFAYTQSKTEEIKIIDHQARLTLDSLRYYQVKEVEMQYYSSDGSDVKIFYEKNKIFKYIKALHFGESGNTLEEYFFSENNLSLVKITRTDFNVPYYDKSYIDSQSKDYTNIIYFKNGKNIYSIGRKSDIDRFLKYYEKFYKDVRKRL